MFDYIEKLRAKKPHEKQMIALGTAFVVTGIIALCWMVTLPYRFSNVQNPQTDTATVSQFQTAKSGITDMWHNVTDRYQTIKSEIQGGLSQSK